MKQSRETVVPLRRDILIDGSGGGHLDASIRRMEQWDTLSDDSRRLVRTCTAIKDFAPQTTISREGEPPIPLWFGSGWACRQKVLPDGRRQIINFIVPGDSLGLYDARDVKHYGSVVSLTAVRAYDASPVETALRGAHHHDLARAFDRERAAQEAMLCDQIVRLGRRTAFERVLHLLAELDVRLTAVGLARGGQFELPLTQEVLADAVGLSIVHVNRTLQQMRREGVLDLRGGRVHVRVAPEPKGVVGQR